MRYNSKRKNKVQKQSTKTKRKNKAQKQSTKLKRKIKHNSKRKTKAKN